MRKLFVLLFIATFLGAGDCDGGEKTTDQKQAEQTEKLTAQINSQVGMPNLTNFKQKKLMKMIFEECDKEGLICYAYLKSDYQGKLLFIGKCLGYGVPFSAQFTNPERVAHRNKYNGGSFGTLPQPDPNGLFMPTSSSATWLMMIDPETKKGRPVYLEPEIVVSPFPLHK